MKVLMQNLVELQNLEFGRDPSKRPTPKMKELRSRIPENILGHYDRLMARGKKGVAPVRNQSCAGCHVRVPLAVIMTLRHADDIQLCDNCGRYLYLPEEETVAAPAAKPAPKKKVARRTVRKANPANG